VETSRRVLGIGQARTDHLAMIDRYPDPETKKELAGLSIQGGGTVATALAVLASFGAEVEFVGKLSDDHFGAFAIQGLEGIGVEVGRCARVAGKMSPTAFIAIEQETMRQTVFFTEGNLEPLLPDEVDPGAFDGVSMLLVDGYHLAAQLAAAEEARRRGARVLLDLGGLRSVELGQELLRLISISHVLVASERRALELAPRGELEDSLLELRRLGPQVVVVTLGREGSIGCEENKIVRQPPTEVELLDTTGAGDVFFGGLAYGVLEGHTLERGMQIASVAASLSCRELGSRAGIPDLDEVEAACWTGSRPRG
jgi:sulfofructose kinase